MPDLEIPRTVYQRALRNVGRSRAPMNLDYEIERQFFLHLNGNVRFTEGTLIRPEDVRISAMIQHAVIYQQGLIRAGKKAKIVRQRIASALLANPLRDLIEVCSAIAARVFVPDQIKILWIHLQSKQFGRGHFDWSVHCNETPSCILAKCISRILNDTMERIGEHDQHPTWTFLAELDDKTAFVALVGYMLAEGINAQGELSDLFACDWFFTKPWQNVLGARVIARERATKTARVEKKKSVKDPASVLYNVEGLHIPWY